MTRKQTVILIALIVFVAGGIIFGAANRINKKSANNNPPQIPPVSDSKNSAEYYTPEVPKNAKPTEPDKIIQNATGQKTETLKIFEIKVTKKGYEPNEITVNKNDDVKLEITAVDGDYDWSMPLSGFYQIAKKGETKLIILEARTPGTYNFECRDYCPGAKIKGVFTILP